MSDDEDAQREWDEQKKRMVQAILEQAVRDRREHDHEQEELDGTEDGGGAYICWSCAETASEFDRSGIAYCIEHWPDLTEAGWEQALDSMARWYLERSREPASPILAGEPMTAAERRLFIALVVRYLDAYSPSLTTTQRATLKRVVGKTSPGW